MTDPKENLLPCPFCGGGVEIDKVDEEHCRNVKIYSAVHCAECGQWFFKGMSEEKAIAAWNRRAVHPHLAQRVIELEAENAKLRAVAEAAQKLANAYGKDALTKMRAWHEFIDALAAAGYGGEE